MVDPPVFRSSVVRPVRPGGSVALDDLSAFTKLSVRTHDEVSAAEALEVGFGRTRRTGDVLVVGIRPAEWLAFGPADGPLATIAAAGLAGRSTIVDVTHGQVAVRVSGAHSTRVLERLCGLDLTDDMTPDGAATSAPVADVTCDVIRDDVEGARAYLLLADRSYGQYLWDVLADAAAEF